VAAAAQQRWWQQGGSIGCAVAALAEHGGSAAAARQWWAVRWQRWQHEGCRGSAAEALDVAAAAWQWRATGRQGGDSSVGRVVAGAAAWRWRWHGGRGGGGGSPITPAMVLPILLIIAAARLGDVAVSLCGLRGGGVLLGGLSSLNVFYQHLLCCALVLWYITYSR
jgi:hypothetical protein